MGVPFPPQFFLLLGIDFFLGTSIVTIMFDEHFPDGLPYLLDLGAFVGFVELALGSGYLSGFSPDSQFYYSAVFVAIAFLCILGANLYLIFRKEKYLLGGVFAIATTIPCFLAMLCFESSYVNGIQVGAARDTGRLVERGVRDVLRRGHNLGRRDDTDNLREEGVPHTSHSSATDAVGCH